MRQNIITGSAGGSISWVKVYFIVLRPVGDGILRVVRPANRVLQYVFGLLHKVWQHADYIPGIF